MDKSAPSKESLERARKFLDEQLELRSPMHSWLESLALEFDTIRRERDEVAEKLKRELEKAEGQLDIILRECQGDDDASLANDYGGTGWEKEVPVATVRWHRRRQAMRIADAVAEEREAAKELANLANMLANEVLDGSEPYHKRETATLVLKAFYAYRARGQKAEEKR